MLYKVVVAQEPVHFGRGDPIMPRLAGWLSVIGVCAPFLYLVWQEVKLTDFHFRKDRRISLSRCATSRYATRLVTVWRA